jgi:8-oxo-dGTP diphosphatase
MGKWDDVIVGDSRYCVGFMFSPDMSQVVLVRKNRPDWQKGLLNGVGGKLKSGESPLNGMIREFHEETGLHWEDWKPLARLDSYFATVWFFWTVSDRYNEASTRTDEKIGTHHTVSIQHHSDVVPNSRWLIPMAMSFLQGERAECFIVEEVY